ncbi:MAG: DUF5052 family protein [Clostridiales bacterium]|nr:DUF5052 family protein [Clostridiales bacterium]
MAMELMITNYPGADPIVDPFWPPVVDGVTVELFRKLTPGKMTFTVLKTAVYPFYEGNWAQLIWNGQNVFLGRVFTKTRDRMRHIKTVCYDQLRYLSGPNNKMNLEYKNRSAGSLLKEIADLYELRWGLVDDTGYKVPKRKEVGVNPIDIIQNNINETLTATGELYVFYDNYGHLDLRNIKDMQLNILLDDETAENYDYTSSIDKQTYNVIKIARDNEATGRKDVFISQSSYDIANWGKLQYFEDSTTSTDPATKAGQLLALYNEKTRELNIKNMFGDARVRPGCSLFVSLVLGDVIINHYMMVDQVTHRFTLSEHTMDLRLVGGTFVT